MNTVGRTFLDFHTGKVGRIIAYHPDVHINHNPKAVPAYEVELAGDRFFVLPPEIGDRRRYRLLPEANHGAGRFSRWGGGFS